MVEALPEHVKPNVGRYNDDFNINCTGDYFQSLHTPTILFEAGHCRDDYIREKTRNYVFLSLQQALKTINDGICKENDVDLILETYHAIPENTKKFYDEVLIFDEKTIGVRFIIKKEGEYLDFIPEFSLLNNDNYVTNCLFDASKIKEESVKQHLNFRRNQLEYYVFN